MCVCACRARACVLHDYVQFYFWLCFECMRLSDTINFLWDEKSVILVMLHKSTLLSLVYDLDYFRDVTASELFARASCLHTMADIVAF